MIDTVKDQVEEVESAETDKPITNWPEEPTLMDLKNDYESAKPHHDTHVTAVDTWLDNLKVQGDAVISKIQNRSVHVPKLIRKQAEWRYTALTESFLSDVDLFDTEPATFADVKASVQNGLVLNHQFNNQLDKVQFIDEYVRTAVDEGTVTVRTGWNFKEKSVTVPNIVPENITDPEEIMFITQATQAFMSNPEGQEQLPPDLVATIEASMQAGRPVRLVEKGTKQEMQTVINQPDLHVCNYNSLIIDPTCKGIMKDAQFVIYEFETSKDALRKEGKYVRIDEIQIEKNAINNTEQGDHDEDIQAFNFKDDARKKFTAFEYWGYWDIDGSGTTKPFVAAWVGETIIRMEESPYPDEGLPFVSVQYLPKRRNVYGEPDGELLEDNQKIIGAVTRGMMDILGRSAAGQEGVRKDALDVTNQRRYDEGLDYEYNPNIDPRVAFYTHTYPEIPNSAMQMLQLQQMEAESLTGVKAFHGGISGEGLGKSATAARSALDAAAKRELGILRRLAGGIIEIGRKISAMNAVFLEPEEVVRITDEEFVTIQRDDLAGRFDIKMSISTAEADNAKAQELAFMLQTTGPNSDPAEVRMIRAEIARLRKMPALAKSIAEYQPQPDPMAIKKAELEIELLQAQIEETKSKTAENYAEAELDMASARNKDSDTDNKDLQFVEEQEGVNQARDLEKAGAQANANLERDVTNKLLDAQLAPPEATPVAQ